MTSLKGQVKFSCAAGRFEKRVKAEISYVSYTLFLPELRILTVKYFLKLMLFYNNGIAKIQKMRKQRYFASTMSMDL